MRLACLYNNIHVVTKISSFAPCLPRSNTVPVLKKLKTWLEQNKYPAHLPIEIRPVAGDDLYLSPAYGRDSTYIGIISYRSVIHRFNN